MPVYMAAYIYGNRKSGNVGWIGIDIDGNPTGSITTEDIMTGNVDSTLSKMSNAQVSVGEPEVWRPESLDVDSDASSLGESGDFNFDDTSSHKDADYTSEFTEEVSE